jgi:hypothetical protein
MAMTAAERKRKQRQCGGFDSATANVTMSQYAKHLIQKMTREYGCTVSELINAMAYAPNMGSAIARRVQKSLEVNEELILFDIDPIFIALNAIYESAAKTRQMKKVKEESKPQPLLETYKPEDL